MRLQTFHISIILGRCEITTCQHTEKEHQVISILVIFTMQDERKNVNILLNFCIPPNHRGAHRRAAHVSSKEEKSINEHFYRKRPDVHRSLWIRANMSKSIKRLHADWRTNKQIDVRFASIISRTINHGSAVPLLVFLVARDFTSMIVIGMFTFLLQDYL